MSKNAITHKGLNKSCRVPLLLQIVTKSYIFHP